MPVWKRGNYPRTKEKPIDVKNAWIIQKIVHIPNKGYKKFHLSIGFSVCELTFVITSTHFLYY